ncbi:nonsense-mediated mRNA decay factor SMG9-like isoform X2 [Plodia interpunctella]|uniref:nonsense-mediated mRNA decay factor SMG9-like isoform X2 n=1 Tax=Plodia interpunctella TaxID=58824 RepID=UPI0023687166|nr:nonsense-mediated mRNA decay factor SMG9-like isoform X2 [Plodia interpunctella]
MSEKKKKVFPNKETTTPRRPVILKSDRETKEQPKEKEKEKPPTIILKTREQSAPKDDRPLSPKTIKTPTAEGDGPHPCKIAQNENKDKKQSEKVSPPLKQMTKPIKLVDENLDFNNAALEFLHDSSTNYLVVGIVGTQGAGKSMILNLITQSKHTQELCRQILRSHEMKDNYDGGNEMAAVENQLEALDLMENEKISNGFKFKMQDIQQIERGVHCTRGVDMYVTQDRVILLDCQPLCSPSLIEESNTNPITARSANVVTVDCLQITSFLMAVCHVLIAVQDWFTDYNFIRYIQAAEMLKPSLSASNTANQEPSESNLSSSSPHLLLLHNRCQLEDYTVDSVRCMQDLYRSNLQLNSGMYMYSDTNKNGLNVDNVSKTYSVETCGTPINMFMLPELYDDFDNREIYRGHPPFEQLAKRLRWMILGVNRHQISNVPNLSERGWFHYCIKSWETIRKCTFFMEYERFLP